MNLLRTHHVNSPSAAGQVEADSQRQHRFEFRELKGCKFGCDCAAAGGYDTCCLPCSLSSGRDHSRRCPVVTRTSASCTQCSGRAAPRYNTCCKFCPERHSRRCPYRHIELRRVHGVPLGMPVSQGSPPSGVDVATGYPRVVQDAPVSLGSSPDADRAAHDAEYPGVRYGIPRAILPTWSRRHPLPLPPLPLPSGPPVFQQATAFATNMEPMEEPPAMDVEYF